MTEQEIVQHMIEYVEEYEKKNQAGRVLADSKSKVSTVNSIINELDKVIKNEN